MGNGPRPRKHLRPWGANDSEMALVKFIEERGKSELVRSGWPDFLLRRKSDNRLFGVEVKTNGDKLRPAQVTCFTAKRRKPLTTRWIYESVRRAT